MFSLTHNQEYLWFLHKLEHETSTYIIPIAWRIRGQLDTTALQESLNALIRRHDALRVRFVEQDGLPLQTVTSDCEWRLAQADLSRLPERQASAELERLLDSNLSAPFDLAKHPPVRGILVRMGPTDHALLLVIHHLVCDDTSRAILAAELAALYKAHCLGLPSPLASEAGSFEAFAKWHRDTRSKDGFSRELQYWTKAVGRDSEQPGPIWNSTESTAQQGSRGARKPVHLQQALVQRLLKFGGSEKCTLFMVLLAGLHALLRRCYGAQSTLIGVPASGRLWESVQSTVGFFVNTLPHRADFSSADTFRQLLAQVRTAAIEGLDHSDMPVGLLAEKLTNRKGAGRQSLITSMFVLRQPDKASELHGLECENISLPCRTSQFPLSLGLVQKKDGLHGYLTYFESCVDDRIAQSLVNCYVTLLESAVNHPDLPLSELELLSAADLELLNRDWMRPPTLRPAGETLHGLIAAQIAKTPQAICIQWGKFKLTYADMERRASLIASLLLSKGLRPGSHVGVCLKRTPNLIAALIGILKAGAAYVPLDPSHPRERLEFLANDSDASVILTESAYSGHFKALAKPVIEIDQGIQLPSATSNLPDVDPDSAAYLMYTSGSTGTPKGVVLTHRNAVNFVRWGMELYTATELSGVLAGTTIGFDLSIVEIFVTLAAGGKILLAENVLHLNDVALSADITMVSTVPSVMEALLSRGPLPPTVTVVNLIGEPLSQSLVRRIYLNKEVRKVYDLYGPAETTTCSTFELRRRDGDQSIGRPIDNTLLYVLDSNRKPAPPGLTGELWIGGAGVARGYHNRQDLTTSRFLHNPFLPVNGGRIYRTGDMVRYLPDGRLAYIGRNDGQVKIRGHRVEPGEIEHHLTAFDSVQQACVMISGQGTSNVELIAFIGVGNSPAPGAFEIKTFLRNRVPEYMVPSRIHVLKELPFNANGKVNRRQLLDLDQASAKSKEPTPRDSAVPQNPLEFELQQIWRRLLKPSAVGLDDNFFEAGGHSLMALALFGEIEKRLGARLPVSTLFQAPTIRQLAGIIQRGGWKGSNLVLVPIQTRGSKPPLYCIHAHGGHVLFYRDLAKRLGDDQPVYGLQAQSLDGVQQPLRTIEEMAIRYVQEIREFQPDGPYQIAGYCAGGIIALEIARRLLEVGESISLLALIETSAPGYSNFNQKLPRWMRWIQGRIQETQLHLGSLLMLNGREKISYIRQRWRHPAIATVEFLLNRFGLNHSSSGGLDPLRLTQKCILEAVGRYKISGYPGTVRLYKTARHRFGANRSSTLGWDKVQLGKLDICETQGYPGALVLEPRVRMIAEDLKRHLSS